MKNIIQLFLFSYFLLCTSSSIAETEAKQAEALVFNCYTCHATDDGRSGEIPKLTGISAKRLEEKLLLFRLDQEQATIMNRIAKGYSEDEIKVIADYLANLK